MLANSNHLRGAFMSEPQESMVYDVDDEHEEAPVSRLHHPPNILCEQDVVFKCYLFFLTGPIDIDSNYQVLYVYIYIYIKISNI